MRGEQFRVIDLLGDLCTDKDVFFRYVRIARDLMTARVHTLTLDHTVYDALQFMKGRKCRHVPVVDAPAAGEVPQAPVFVGVVSDRDLLRQVSPHWGTSFETDEDARALKTPLTTIVSRKPTCVSLDTPISDVLGAMCETHVDMMPVVDGGKLAGVITAGDVIGVFVLLGKMGQLCCENAGKMRLIDLFADKDALETPLVRLVARTVADIMTKGPLSLAPTDILRNAVEAMQQGRLGSEKEVSK